MASALGDVTFGGAGNNVKRTICLLAAATATNSPPAAATAGVPSYGCTSADMMHVNPKGAFFLGKGPDVGRVAAQVVSTAGSGTMTAKVTIWGYLEGTGINQWVKVKALNGGSDIAETSTDKIAYHEVVDGLGVYDRLYAEVVAIAGTSTAIEVYLTTTLG